MYVYLLVTLWFPASPLYILYFDSCLLYMLILKAHNVVHCLWSIGKGFCSSTRCCKFEPSCRKQDGKCKVPYHSILRCLCRPKSKAVAWFHHVRGQRFDSIIFMGTVKPKHKLQDCNVFASPLCKETCLLLSFWSAWRNVATSWLRCRLIRCSLLKTVHHNKPALQQECTKHSGGKPLLEKCIGGESNPGLPRGRREFYHWTTNAEFLPSVTGNVLIAVLVPWFALKLFFLSIRLGLLKAYLVTLSFPTGSWVQHYCLVSTITFPPSSPKILQRSHFLVSAKG